VAHQHGELDDQLFGNAIRWLTLTCNATK